MMTTDAHYKRPGWFAQHVFNRFVGWLTRRGVSVWGSRVLEVPGRCRPSAQQQAGYETDDDCRRLT